MVCAATNAAAAARAPGRPGQQGAGAALVWAAPHPVLGCCSYMRHNIDVDLKYLTEVHFFRASTDICDDEQPSLALRESIGREYSLLVSLC